MIVYRWFIHHFSGGRVQEPGRDKLRSLKMAIMDKSLVNPGNVYSGPVAGVLAIGGPPVIPRAVEVKAFQEVIGWEQPCISTLSQSQKHSILAGVLGCAGLPPCVFSHRDH